MEGVAGCLSCGEIKWELPDKLEPEQTWLPRQTYISRDKFAFRGKLGAGTVL